MWRARPIRRGTVCASSLVTVTAMLTGCGDDAFDPHDPTIEQARLHTVGGSSRAVEAALVGLAIHAAARTVACERGQDNFLVQDPYRWRCGAGYAAIAGVAGEVPHEAVQTAHTALTTHRVGPALAADTAGMQGLASANGTAGKPGPIGYYHCHRHRVEVQLVRSDDPRIASLVEGLPKGPFGLFLVDERLDGAAAAADARAHDLKHLLIADAGEEYFQLPAQQ